MFERILTSILLLFTTIIYCTPGILFSLFFIPKSLNSNLPKQIYLSILTSIAISSIIGLVLRNSDYYNLLVKGFYTFTSAGILVVIVKKSLLSATYVKKAFSYKILTLPIIFASYFLLFHNGSYLRGWDASNHFTYFLQFHTSGIADTEIGALIEPFYPRGVSAAASMFTSIIDLDPITTFKIFCVLITGILPLSAFSFSNELFSDDKASIIIAEYASIISIVVGYLILPNGHFPFLLSLQYLGFLIIVLHQTFGEDWENFHKAFTIQLPLFLVLLFGLVLTHNSLVMFYVLTLGAIIVYGIVVKNNKKSQLKKYSYVFFINIASMTSIILYFVIFQYKLLLGQIRFYFSHQASSESIQNILVRTTTTEFSILILTPVLIFPFIIGLIQSCRKKVHEEVYLGFLFSSALVLFTNVIPPFNAREPYYMFYILSAVGGFGLCKIFKNIKIVFNNTSEQIKKSIIGLLIILALSNLTYTLTGHLGSRQNYIADQDFALGEFINTNGITHQTVATINKPSNRLLDVITSNKIILGDEKHTDIQSHYDTAQIFSPDTDSVALNKVIKKYNISAILIDFYEEFPVRSAFNIIQKLNPSGSIDQEGIYGNLIHQAFTLEVWINPESALGSIITKGNSDEIAAYDWNLFGDGTQLKFIVSNGNTAVIRLQSMYPSLNNWHHIAVVWDGTREANSSRLYLDGELVDQFTPIDNETTHNYEIHIQPDSFIGKINGVRIYSRALTYWEIQYNMFNSKEPIARGLQIHIPRVEEQWQINSLVYQKAILLNLSEVTWEQKER